MDATLQQLLPHARGEARWVVAINADIRDFTAFTGPRMESVQAALFLKLIYQRMLTDYFPDANFVKSTGDGLMIIYHYDEGTLGEVFSGAVSTAVGLVDDFPSFVKDNPLVNFDVPTSIGIGIAHGAASELRTDDSVIDYFGKPLNLASRLMDYARPRGVVADDNLLLPPELKRKFSPVNVYVRGIADEKAMKVHALKNRTKVPTYAMVPIVEPTWKTLPEKKYLFRTLKSLADQLANVTFEFPKRPFNDEISIKISAPAVTKKGYKSKTVYVKNLLSEHYAYEQDRGRWRIRIRSWTLVPELETQGIKEPWEIVFNVAYSQVPGT